MTENNSSCETEKNQILYLYNLDVLVLAIIDELVNLLLCILAILVHFDSFWLTAFILVHFGKLGTSYFGQFCFILVKCVHFGAFSQLGSSYFWSILVNCDNFGTF